MVGLVIVSHTAKLAEGVAELARGMSGPALPLGATGGLDLPPPATPSGPMPPWCSQPSRRFTPETA